MLYEQGKFGCNIRMYLVLQPLYGWLVSFADVASSCSPHCCGSPGRGCDDLASFHLDNSRVRRICIGLLFLLRIHEYYSNFQVGYIGLIAFIKYEYIFLLYYMMYLRFTSCTQIAFGLNYMSTLFKIFLFCPKIQL